MPRALATVVVALAVVALVATIPAACASDTPDGGGRAPRDASTTTSPSGPTTASTTPYTLAPGDATVLLEAACDGRLEVAVVGRLPDDLTSISGLAASHRHEGVVWAVEDSFEPAQLVALDLTGAVLARIDVVGEPLMNLDWEALAVGPGPDGSPWVHVGDLGDNLGIRGELRVHRFPEPDLDARSVRAETLAVRHPDDRPNVEAMAVDGEGRTWVVEKAPDGPAGLFVLGDEGRLEQRAELDLGGEQATALDVSPDGSLVALRTNRSLRLHPVPPGGDLVGALSGDACTTPQLDERQGESVAVLPGGQGLVTVSEDESGGAVDLHLTAPAP